MKSLSKVLVAACLSVFLMACNSPAEPEPTGQSMSPEAMEGKGISEGTAPSAGGGSSPSAGEAPQGNSGAIQGDL